ncbi:hypothetical protein [Desulfoluna spongiiphila]|nr:hypothetical protein [Desulfoluna spongiiphila]
MGMVTIQLASGGSLFLKKAPQKTFLMEKGDIVSADPGKACLKAVCETF